MRVDRIGVEQVVLHTPNDPAEGGNIKSQHAVGIHSPQRSRDALRCPEDIQEQAVISRILAKLFVDEPEMLLDQCDGSSVDALEVEVFLQKQEDLEQRGRILHEDVLVDRFEIAVARLKMGPHDRCRRVGIDEDGFFEELQQHFVDAAELHDGSVVALHQLLDGERVGCVLVAEHLRQFDLMVEQTGGPRGGPRASAGRTACATTALARC